MDKRFLTILAVVVLAFVGIFAVSRSHSLSSNSPPTNHVEGKNKASVTLLEYGDYQCTACEGYYQAVKTAVAQLNKQITFQFRNLPLPSLHPNAFAAARAAEAASLQGKFWQMHDLLYDPVDYNQWALNPATRSVTNENPKPFFDQYAKLLGLNVTTFDKDYASSQVADSINADIAAFLNTSYANHSTAKEATPSFFINGQYVDRSNFVDSSSGPSAAKIIAYIQNFINTKH